MSCMPREGLVSTYCRQSGSTRGQMIANGHDNYNGPRQIADRPWEGSSMQGGPRRPQPPSQHPSGGPMQNGTGILAAVGQQVTVGIL